MPSQSGSHIGSIGKSLEVEGNENDVVGEITPQELIERQLEREEKHSTTRGARCFNCSNKGHLRWRRYTDRSTEDRQSMKAIFEEKGALAWAGCRKGNSTFYIASDPRTTEAGREGRKPSGAAAERHSFLQYAMLHFRDTSQSDSGISTYAGSMRGTVRLLEYLTGKKSKRGQMSDWTWKELTDKVKYSPFPILSSLLKLESDYLNRLAVDSFTAIMKFMGDLPLSLHQKEVECVYTILVICHHHLVLRDEIFCQIMKQTTNNKSLNPDSRIRGWRLFAFLLAFFKCSEALMPYLMKYLDSAAQDLRRLEQATAEICIFNLNQTLKYGGRRNVPTENEVNAVIDGKLSKQQNYFLPGGVQLILSTSSSTVVGDIIRCICFKMGISNDPEFSEFSLYCIVEGDQYTMPLESDEYILDLIAELERNENKYYLVFCRSVWYYELRLDSELYIEIIFHQIIPDYLEGYLIVTPLNCTRLPPKTLEEISRIAHLLHRANGINTAPNETDMIYLLPKPVLNLHKESVQCVASSEKIWEEMTALNTTEAKAQCLELLHKWSLFGSCFFGVKMLGDGPEEEYILAVNKSGVNILHLETHETIWRFSFAAAHLPSNSTKSDGTTYTDIEFGDRNFKKIIRLQVDHAHEISRLIKQYALIQEQRKESESVENYPKVMIKV